MKKTFLFSLLIAVCFKGFAQSVELHPNQGISVPQFTTVFIDALINQPKGTVVFDKDLNLMKYWNGTAWINLTTGGSSGVGWVENGTHIENTNTGNVGIGVTSPTAKLAIVGTAPNGTLAVSGSLHASHFNYPTSGLENTYIRGGNAGSHVLLNDSEGLGNVGVGTSIPYSKLDVNGDARMAAPAMTYSSLFSEYVGGSLLLDNTTGDDALMRLDGNKIQGFATNNVFGYSPNKLVLNPFGGNVGIGTNFTPEYKLHLYSTGEQLIKVDGSNSLMLFNDRTSNAQYGFLRAWTNNPFNPEGNYGLEVGVPPAVGGDPAKHLMFSSNHTLRMVLRNDGEIILNGQTHKTHFFHGTNLDTYIRGGKNGSNIILSDVEASGKVGIGRYPTVYKLEVNGTVKANEVIVETGWADYVFDDTFKLKPLSEVARFIKENKHLPDIPSAEEIQQNGAKLSELTTKMMQKIEELTLYSIEQHNKIEQLREELKVIKAQK